MKKRIEKELELIEDDLIQFTQELIKIRSFTQQEAEIAQCVKKKMMDLGYDDVIQDPMGNIIGVIGSGETKLMYDSHLDTVSEGDTELWSVDPFGGEIKDNRIYGRGSVDMKAAIAATVYAGYAIKRLGLDQGKTIYISTSVMEEDFDGQALQYILDEGTYKPDMVVICEPSSMQLATGHHGRALMTITTEGISAHGSAPDKGVNAVYEMSQITERVRRLQEDILSMDREKGSLALTKIESEAVSLNAIPAKCRVYLDRRLTLCENRAFINNEMATLVEGVKATWSIHDEVGTSYTGLPIVLHSFLPAWEIAKDHAFVKSAIAAFEMVEDVKLNLFKWDFCTNGVASAGKHGIPTIGIGPGDAKLAHKVDEFCELNEIKRAFKFYTMLPGLISSLK